MKETGKMTRQTAKAFTPTWMGPDTREIGLTTNSKATESKDGLTGLDMKVRF
jgi:hypothetical protein